MHSLWLLTAAWMTAAPVDSPVVYSTAPQGEVVTVMPSQSAPTFRERVRMFFGQRPPATYSTPTTYPVVTSPQGAPAAPVSPYAQAMPSISPSQPGVTIEVVDPSNASVTVTVQRPNIQLPQGGQARVGHEHDYSWITGYLYYVHTNGGRWVLRYASLDQVDRFGGSVVLALAVEMKNYREGDLVCVHGEVLDEGRSGRSLGGALYRVNAISMVERADQ